MKKFFTLFVCVFALASCGFAQEGIKKVKYHLDLECFPSEELDDFAATIPDPDYKSPNVEAWIETTLNELDHLRALIASGQFGKGVVDCGVNYDQAEAQ